MILINVRLLSELPLAIEMSRRLVASGEAIAFCAETEDAATMARLEQAGAELKARTINMAALVRAAEAKAANPQGGGWADRVSSSMRSWLPDRRSEEDRALDESPKGKAFLAALGHEISAAREVIASIKPTLLIVFQDGVSANYALIKAAREAGIPIVDCPYGSGTTRDFDDYLDEKAAENNLNFVEGRFGERVKRDYPHWVRQNKRGELLMFPAEYVLVRERLGLSLPLPWVIHGGVADVLAAESEEMQRRYLEEGVAPPKVRLTGTVYCDVMHDQLQASPEAAAAFAGARKLRAGQTSMLVSLPPSLHEIRKQFSEFPTYEDACAAIASMVKERGINATVSLHPNASAEQRAFIESLGLTLSDEWILSLIPRFDLFFTTFSSTIRWAIACGKPVLNYNMYGYRCHDYDGVDGVITRATLQEIAHELDRLTDDQAYGARAARQKDDGRAWGMLDGKNFERVYAVINDLRGTRRREARG